MENRSKAELKSLNVSIAMEIHHANRTKEQKEATRQKQADAAVCKMWIPKGPRYGRQLGSANKVDPNTPVGTTTLAKIEKASVKRILKDLVGTRPELIMDALIAGLLATPPRSFPYIALAAAYLDGKPINAEPSSEVVDLSNLTKDELMQRALAIAQTLKDGADGRLNLAKESMERAAREARGVGLAVIDAVVIPQPSDKRMEEK